MYIRHVQPLQVTCTFPTSSVHVHYFSTVPLHLYYLDYKFGVRLAADCRDLILLNALNEDDQSKFVEDLKEAILEVSLLSFIIFIYLKQIDK